MRALTDETIAFFYRQGFVIVSSIDPEGSIHNSCKGIVDINRSGRVYLFDLYLARTLDNLKRNPHISITAVDEHKFMGYSLKGKASLLTQDAASPQLIKAWEERITSRLTQRLLKNIREEKGHPGHPEALLPNPKYLIAMDVEDIIDLTPRHLK